MTSLPIPFVVAFLLVLLATAYRPQFKETPSGELFAVVLYVNAVSLALIGLRWSRDMVSVLPVVATLAVVSSALLYLAFCSLGRRGPVIVTARDWWHLIPIVLVALSSLFFWRWVDFSLIFTKCCYAVLFIRLASNTNNTLQLVRLSWLSNTQRALWGAVALLLSGIALDVAIAVDFALYEGRHAESLVGIVSFGTLLVLGWVVVQAARGRTRDTPIDTHIVHKPDSSQYGNTNNTHADSDNKIEPDAKALLERLNSLLISDCLYADSELNLQRLARKAGVPSRIISRTINSQTGLNVSQWVNHARIEAVCNLLQHSGKSVNDAMLESGFLTKSNFNREFRRIKGCSPSEWRHSEKRKGQAL